MGYLADLREEEKRTGKTQTPSSSVHSYLSDVRSAEAQAREEQKKLEASTNYYPDMDVAKMWAERKEQRAEIPPQNNDFLDRAGAYLEATNPLTKVFGVPEAIGNLAVKGAQEREANRNKLRDLRKSGGGTLGEISKLSASTAFGTPFDKLLAKGDPQEEWSVAAQAREKQQIGAERFKKGLGTGGRMVADIAIGAGNLAGDLAVSSAAGVPITALYGVTGGAEAARNALGEGYGANKALTAGAASGVVTSQIERLGGVGGNLAGKYIGKLAGTATGKAFAAKAPKAVEYIAKLANNKLVQILGDAASEGLEEFTEYDVQRVINNLILDKDTPRDVKEQLYNTVMGAGIGGLFGVASRSITNKPPQTATNAPTAAADTTAQQQVHTPTEAQGEDLQAAGAQDIPAVQTKGVDKLAALEQERKIKASNMAYIYADYKMSTEDTLRPEIFSEYNAAKKELSEIDAEIRKEKAMLQEKEKANSEARKASQTKQSVINILEAEKNLFISDEAVNEISATGLYAEETQKVIAFKKQAARQMEEINVLLHQLDNAKSLDKKAEIDDKIRATDFLLNKSVEKLQQAQDALKIRAQKEASQVLNADLRPPEPTVEPSLRNASYNTTIPQGKNGVNTQYMQDGVNNAAPVPPLDTSTVSAGKTASNLNFVNQDVMNAADTIGQTVKQTARTAYQQVVSGQAPIERLSKANAADNPDIDAATQMARQAGGIVDSIAEDALVSKDFEKIGISYTKLMKKIPKENLAEFNDYAQNLHNINRMSLEDNAIQAVNRFELSHPQVVGTPINTLEEMAKSNDDSAVLAREYLRLITKAKETKNKPVFGELIERITPSGKVVQELGGRTAEQSRQIVKDYEAAHPEYREIMNEIEAWWDKFGQSWYVDTGLVSKKSYDAMREMYPNYIPTHREEKQNTFGRGLFGKSVSTPKVIGAATGGAGKIIPLEESFMAQIDRTVRAAQRNELYRTILKVAETDPKTAALHGVAISKKSGGTFDTADIDGFLDQVEQQTIKQLESGGFEVTVLVDGEKVTLDVSKEVGECLRWLEDKGMSESWLKNFIGLGKSLTSPSKAAITGINALFAITNTVKDGQTYFINSISNNPIELVSNYGRAILDVALKRETYQTYKATGGARSGFYGQQRGFKKSFEKPFSELTPLEKIGKLTIAPIAAPFKAAAKLGEFTEQIPRVAEFRNAIARYGNTPEGLKRAAFAAADVTTNFSRGAPITKVADAWVLYINPQVQGLDKTARQIKNRPIATLSKASVLSIATLLLALVNRDNPNYDELDNRTKDTYFLLPNEKNLDENGYAKTFYKIPKSREWGAIMSSSFDRIAKYMETQDLAESFRGYGSTFANNLLPSNPITDNILSPVLINLKSNRDFAGRNIVPQSMQNLSPRNQYDITTSGIARAVGKRFNLSPKQIDYLIGSYMGYPGAIIQALSSPKNIGRTPEETAMNAIQMAIVQPFERRFTADPLYNSVTIDKLYHAIEQASTDAADKNFEENIPQDVVTPEDKRKSYLTKAAVDIAELRTEEKNILAEFLPIKEKEQKIDEVRRKMNNIAKEAITTVDDYVSAYEKTYVPETSMLGEKMQAAYRDMQNLITPQQFADVYNAQKGIKGDKDRHGKTIYLSASKKKKAAIDTAARGLPKYVKYDLYDAFGVSEEIW